MTNRVIICEGEKDTRFLSVVCENVVGSRKYDVFDNETAEITETDRIRRHLTDNTIDYLFKSEGGKTKLKKIAPKVAMDLCGKNMDLVVVVDLDSTLVSDFIEALNNELRQDHGNRVEITQESSDGNEDMFYVSCDIRIHSRMSGSFKLVAFVDDHEEAVGISEGDDVTTQKRKIEEYISEKTAIVSDFADFVY